MEDYPQIIEYFSFLKQNGRIAPAYLFVGRDLAGFSRKVAKLVNCPYKEIFCNSCDICREADKPVCADIMFVEPETNVKIEHIREAQKFVSLSPVRLDKKVLIINRAHTMRDEAANAFLKTLEEPPGRALIIVLADRLDTILPTILSRCCKLYFPLKEQYKFKKQALLSDFFSQKQLSFKERPKAADFFMDLIVYLRDSLVDQLTQDKNKLLEPASCEIISHPGPDCADLQYRLERALELYNNLDTINLNLAANLMRVACQIRH